MVGSAEPNSVKHPVFNLTLLFLSHDVNATCISKWIAFFLGINIPCAMCAHGKHIFSMIRFKPDARVPLKCALCADKMTVTKLNRILCWALDLSTILVHCHCAVWLFLPAGTPNPPCVSLTFCFFFALLSCSQNGNVMQCTSKVNVLFAINECNTWKSRIVWEFCSKCSTSLKQTRSICAGEKNHVKYSGCRVKWTRRMYEHGVWASQDSVETVVDLWAQDHKLHRIRNEAYSFEMLFWINFNSTL